MRLRVVCVVIAFGALLGGCVTTPIIPQGEQGQVIDVSVAKARPTMGTRNLAEDVRVKTQNAAYRFSEVGPRLSLHVKITSFQGPSAGMALFISSGTSSIGAEISVTNEETGKTYEPKNVFAANPRMGGVIGAIHAASVDPISDERDLATKLAEAIMKQIYGDAAATKAAAVTPTKRATANYPVSYTEESQRLECRNIALQNGAAIDEAEGTHDKPILRRVPDYCAKYEKTS